MFSVIIPLYNKEVSIKETVFSVLNQSFIHFEIIIVNDGSTDNSLKVVQEIQDPRIRIVDKINGGVSSARNRGVKEACNEWVTFLDGDDLWELNHLEEYAIAIQNNKLNWLISGYTAIKSQKKYIKIYNWNGIFLNIFDDLSKGLKIHTSTVCIKRQLFEKYPDLYFKEGINNSEDREVWYKLCGIDNNPYYIRKSLSIYRLDDVNSLTKNQTADHFLKVFDRLKHSLIYKELSSENQQKLIKYLNDFNLNSIKGYYIHNSVLKHNYKDFLPKITWHLLCRTSNLPVIVKKIIAKLC